MSTLKLNKKRPEWRKHFRPGEKVDPAKVERLMKETYPGLFGEVRLLPIGIHKLLLEDPGLPVTRKQARLFLWRWTHQPRYQAKLEMGEQRITPNE